MFKCWIFVAFIWNISLLFPVSLQAETVSDIFDELNRTVSYLITNSSERQQLTDFQNKTFNYYGCSCGYDSTGCYYFNDRKICYCNSGFAQNDETCQRCYCGADSSDCKFVDGEKICECNSGYFQKTDICEKCDCGRDSSGCKGVDGKVVCECNSGYSQNGDKCERCDCGYNSNKCYFENNKKICSCDRYYAQNSNGKCQECDCGYYAESCEIKSYSKVCTCNYGYIYAVNSGKCERCDCGPRATSCQLTFDMYSRCTCEQGYVAERSRWEMDEECKLPGPSGWRIATYVEGLIFGIIIVVCSAIICCNRSSFS